MVDNRETLVTLKSMKIEDKWEDDKPSEATFGKNPDVKWFVEYTLDIGYKKKSYFRRLWKGHNDLDVGYISLLVCSPAFKNNPVDYTAGKMSTALVQTEFNAKAVRKYLDDNLEKLTGLDSEKKIIASLKKFVNIT